MLQTRLNTILGTLALLAGVGSPFKQIITPIHTKHRWNVGLTRNGVAEWREKGSNVLALIPFSLDEILLPGQSRYLHFYEERLVRMGKPPYYVKAATAVLAIYVEFPLSFLVRVLINQVNTVKQMAAC